MGSVSEEELAGLEWMLELLPKLGQVDEKHQLLQYFEASPHGWAWKSPELHRAFLDKFWQRPEPYENKPGAVVRMVTYGNFCVAARNVIYTNLLPAPETSVDSTPVPAFRPLWSDSAEDDEFPS